MSFFSKFRSQPEKPAPPTNPSTPQGSRIPSAAEEQIAAFVRSIDQPDEGARRYLEIHIPRIARTLSLTPPPRSSGRVLELGAYMHMTPALQCVLGYQEVRGAYYGPLGRRDQKTVTAGGGKEIFHCTVDLFDAEKDRYPYPDGHFETVLCCEIIEHLLHDPMHMLLEINRVLEDNGTLVISTPNMASFTAVARILEHKGHPQVYAHYADPRGEYADTEIPHVHEYTPGEMRDVLTCSGFEVESLITDVIPGYGTEERMRQFLTATGYPTDDRGEQMYAIARKRRPKSGQLQRYPKFLYDV
jgi:SAM-dependent methyltransferase